VEDRIADLKVPEVGCDGHATCSPPGAAFALNLMFRTPDIAHAGETAPWNLSWATFAGLP
jgi:hypothetical protein